MLAARQAPYTGISGLGEQGMFQACWKTGLAKYDEVKGIDWTWLSADGGMTKAPVALLYAILPKIY